jgi:hypothetical protein
VQPRENANNRSFKNEFAAPWWRRSSTYISGTSLLASIIAVIVSLSSSNTAKESLRLARLEYVSQRRAVLFGLPTPDSDGLTLKSADASITINKIHVDFPEIVSRTTVDVLPPDFELALFNQRAQLATILKTAASSQLQIAQAGVDAELPAILEVSYIAKNEGYNVRGLYLIGYDFIIPTNPKHQPEITFRSLTFVRHLEPTEDQRRVLAAAWQKFGLRLNA